eukprot:CAMPEP_0174252348 /NCGR_PEP_ID=MMETSP0439-20130205/1859_1 /TAXON_ID=0 /ORGANISM="Stereomyxa ramosa, Strain Chinc5" /LENGTH=140 /DNA_ID=CAMNT_0015332869 /DNA_START=38 /DNA_END=460 /DNA_ORIENTATION=-
MSVDSANGGASLEKLKADLLRLQKTRELKQKLREAEERKRTRSLSAMVASARGFNFEDWQIPEDVMDTTKTWKIQTASITDGQKLRSTSQTHTFRPPVPLEEAVQYLYQVGAKNCCLIFMNQSGVNFKDGRFASFEHYKD